MPEIRTERLLLRRPTLKDAKDLFAYARDPEVAKFITWKPHKSISDSKKAILWMDEQYAGGRAITWGLIHPENAQFIGTCGLVALYPKDERAELGYAMSREYWGKGYMTEAVRAVLTFGFETMKLNRIEAKTNLDNEVSFRLLEKVGMTYEGVLRQYTFCKGQHFDLKMYSLLRSEYEHRSGAP